MPKERKDNLRKGNPDFVFSKENQPSSEAKSNGHKKATARRSNLKKLLKDLVITNKQKITYQEKALLYQMYEIGLSDYVFYKSADIGVKHLYFMRSSFGIKIGISKDCNNRLTQIQKYAPETKILKVIQYASNFENQIHKKFKRQNIKGNTTYGIEWFFINDDLLEFIDQINSVEDLCVIFNKSISKQLLLNL
jgi:hypothetical protein